MMLEYAYGWKITQQINEKAVENKGKHKNLSKIVNFSNYIL